VLKGEIVLVVPVLLEPKAEIAPVVPVRKALPKGTVPVVQAPKVKGIGLVVRQRPTTSDSVFG
ncbi:MAG TPA: hypothetical protein VLA12_16105, partial [Planctomycetaceae bacterium]|nr:hypothetical protein [Planctomycetaceae bacterium]